MDFMLFFLFVFILLQFIFLCLIFSNLVVDIEECDILYNSSLKKKFDIRKLKINVKIYVFNFIRILNIKIYENYCEIFKIKIQLNALKRLKDDKESGWIFVIKNLKKLNPEVQKININLDIGTEEPIITTFSIPVLSMFFSIILSKSIKKYDKNNYDFKINPIFSGANILFLSGNAKLNFNTMRVVYFIKKHKQLKV